MSAKPRNWVAIVAVVVGISACGREGSQPLANGDGEELREAAVELPPRGCTVAGDASGVPEQICALLDLGLERSVVSRYEKIRSAAAAGDVARASGLALELVDFLIALGRRGELDDPNGSAPPTTAAALAVLVGDLMRAAGVPVDDIAPDAFTEGYVGVIGGDEGGTVVSENELYGAQFPPGWTGGDVLVVLDPLPDGSDPLQTGELQRPKYVFIETYPEVESFERPVTVGLCAVTDGLTEEQVAALRVAHNVGDGVEVLEELVAPPFDLDCEEASIERPRRVRETLSGAGRAIMRPHVQRVRRGPGADRAKGIGGTVSSFSPFGAVVHGDEEPAFSTIEGTVTDGEAPLSAATVQIDCNGFAVEIPTNSAGAYAFDGAIFPPLGFRQGTECVIAARRLDTGGVHLGDAQTFTVAAGNNVRDLEAPFHPLGTSGGGGAQVRGTVRSAFDGTPITGALVALVCSDEPLSAYAVGDGETGTFSFAASDWGFGPGSTCRLLAFRPVSGGFWVTLLIHMPDFTVAPGTNVRDVPVVLFTFF